MKIDNFYTATIYEKGAELVRMLKTILGPEMFRAGSDRYFEKCDGTAATVEDAADGFVILTVNAASAGTGSIRLKSNTGAIIELADSWTQNDEGEVTAVTPAYGQYTSTVTEWKSRRRCYRRWHRSDWR